MTDERGPVSPTLTVAPRSVEVGPKVEVGGLPITNVFRQQLVDHVFAQLADGVGGWIVTANTDFLVRVEREPELGALYRGADVIVADGMPILWAAKLQGTPLVDRVAGSDLAWLLAEAAADFDRRVYLLGGDDGIAEKAKAKLEEIYPRLQVCGASAPWVKSPPLQEEVDTIRAELELAAPDIVYVALSSPKQEQLIAALREEFPQTWFIGVGISLSFIVGAVKRAPVWMQRLGIEWVHRMIQEPRKLAKRYLIDDIPYALRLLLRSKLKQ